MNEPTSSDHDAVRAENERLREELRVARAQLINYEIAVRARIGRDLHDGPIQQVASAGLHINYLRRVMERAPTLLSKSIDELDDQLAQAMISLRTVLLELHPIGLEEHGLCWMLEQYAAKFPAWGALQVLVDVEPSLPRLPLDCEKALFIIIQEAIMNVRKHAAASKATITVRAVDHTMRFVVSDDGQGFELAQQRRRQAERGSIGLLSMEERVRHIGGTLRIDSAPGSGTAVTITVPFEGIPTNDQPRPEGTPTNGDRE